MKRRRSQIRITRVYTRRGDAGETDLVGGVRVAKDSARIEAYGVIDETNAAIGVAREQNRAMRTRPRSRARIEEILRRIQNELFNVGSELATPVEALHPMQAIVQERHVRALEREIDDLNADLPILKSFILPGGGPVGAALHVARTTARRAERVLVALSRIEEVRPEALRYVNRLSDHLFVLGRWAARTYGEPEPIWVPEKT